MDKLATLRLFEPFLATFCRIILTGWKSWTDLPDEVRYALRHERTRANVLWAFIQNDADKAFENTPIRKFERYGTYLFTLGESSPIVFRFKKMDEDGFSQNFPTRFSLDYNEQLELPDVPSTIRVDIGYVLNDLKTEIEKVLISRRDGNRILWKHEISERVAAEVSNIYDARQQRAKPVQKRARIKQRDSGHADTKQAQGESDA